VATFIGTANQFFGQVAGKDLVDCTKVKLFADGLKDFSNGQSVVVLVRPENIQVQSEQPRRSNLNIIQGEIETITFHGAVTRLGVNVSGQRVVADITVANTEAVSLNQKIWLSFPSDACQVMAVNE
jgi:ABC-type Fe3+/spermidine/putrescine transport system ATPase subunit